MGDHPELVDPIQRTVERRLHDRRTLNKIGLAKLHGMTLGRCIIKDLSEGGAKLLFEEGKWMPSEFELLDSDHNCLGRARRVWKSKSIMGVQFLKSQNILSPNG